MFIFHMNLTKINVYFKTLVWSISGLHFIKQAIISSVKIIGKFITNRDEMIQHLKILNIDALAQKYHDTSIHWDYVTWLAECVAQGNLDLPRFA